MRSRVIAFFLTLVLMMYLCACAQDQQTAVESDEPKISAGREISDNIADKDVPEKQSGEPDAQPAQIEFSEEAEQSIGWLRDRIDVPETMFGVSYLGYTGDAADGDRLSAVNQAILQEYPFIEEIDAEHTVGIDNYLYCLLPVDEKATVSVNLIKWNPASGNEEVLEVLYRSEYGDPLLILADCGDDAYAYDSYIQVRIVDSAGRSCEWYPQLDAMGCIVPCLSENGDYVSFDFTEYGWMETPAELAPWLSDGYGGVYASGLEGCWTTQAEARDAGGTADFYLWFYPESYTGGSIYLDWNYDGADVFEEMWSGFWTLTCVMDGPSYVTISMSLVGGESYDATDDPYYITETYPLLISPSGEEMVIGAGLCGVSLPFMPKHNSQLCILTLDSWFTESPDW